MDLNFSKDLTPAETLAFASEFGCRRFVFLITSIGSQITRNQPKRLSDEIKSKIQAHKCIEDLHFNRANKIVITTQNLECAKQVCKLDKILGVAVSVAIQQETITSKFLLRDMPIDIATSDIVEEVECSNPVIVSEARRFTRIIDDSRVPTNLVLFTVIGTHLPPNIKTWYINHKISSFIDRPRQCTRCYQFNHSVKSCQQPAICARCGSLEDHKICNLDPICCNCQGNHPANDKSCPNRSEEQRFLEFKQRNHLSFAEARKAFTKSTPKSLYSQKSSNFPQQNNPEIDSAMAPSSIQKEFVKLSNSFVVLQDQQIKTADKLESLAKSLESLVTIIKTHILKSPSSPSVNVIQPNHPGPVKERSTEKSKSISSHSAAKKTKLSPVIPSKSVTTSRLINCEKSEDMETSNCAITEEPNLSSLSPMI